MNNEITNIYGIEVQTSKLIDLGKKYCDRKRKTLITWGAIISGFSYIYLFMLFVEPLGAVITIACLNIPSIIFFITAFTKFGTKNYVKYGTKIYKIENKIYDDKKGESVDRLQCDKSIVLSRSPRVCFYINLKGEFQLYINDSYTKIYKPEDLIDYEIRDNQKIITNKQAEIKSRHKGGLGGAIVGGALFGGAGMVTGAVLGRNRTTSVSVEKEKAEVEHNYYLVLTVKNIDNPVIKANIASEKEADEVIALLFMVVEKDKNLKFKEENVEQIHKQNISTNSSAEEIRKFKSLLDDGIITKEEFEAKKKKLLDL